MYFLQTYCGEIHVSYHLAMYFSTICLVSLEKVIEPLWKFYQRYNCGQELTGFGSGLEVLAEVSALRVLLFYL